MTTRNPCPTNRTHAHVADVPFPLSLSEISEAQKTDDFCETVFATLASKPKSFFFEGEVSYDAETRRFRSSNRSWSLRRFAPGSFTSSTTAGLMVTQANLGCSFGFVGRTIGRLW